MTGDIIIDTKRTEPFIIGEPSLHDTQTVDELGRPIFHIKVYFPKSKITLRYICVAEIEPNEELE